MSRALISVPDEVTSGEFTEHFFDFFERYIELTGADLVVDRGISSLENEAEAALPLFREDAIRDAEKVITELLVVFLIDNFQTYLTGLLVEIHSMYPEMIASSQTKNSVIFELDDIEELKKRVIERHVADLSYKSIDDLEIYFREKLKIKFLDSRMTVLRMNRLIQLRNLVVHNRGRINQFFISKVGAKVDRLNEHVKLPNPHAAACFLIRVASSLDRKLQDKYAFSTRRMLSDQEATEILNRLRDDAR